MSWAPWRRRLEITSSSGANTGGSSRASAGEVQNGSGLASTRFGLSRENALSIAWRSCQVKSCHVLSCLVMSRDVM